MIVTYLITQNSYDMMQNHAADLVKKSVEMEMRNRVNDAKRKKIYKPGQDKLPFYVGAHKAKRK